MYVNVCDEFEVEIERLGVSGEGVGSWQGYTVFVDGALPTERVRVRLVERRRRFGRGQLLERLTSSPDRVEPVCPLFGRCGGCQLMHLKYSQQLVAKRQRVVDALERIGKFEGIEVADCVPSPSSLHYRNKIQLPVCENLELGLYARGSHDLVPIERCFIHCDLGERAFQAIAAIVKGAQLEKGFLRYALIKTALHTEQVLVVLVTRGEGQESLKTLARQMMEAVPEIKGVVQNVNRRPGNVILGEIYRTLAGHGSIEEEICGLTFKVSPASFFQVNPSQAQQLYQRAIECAALTGKEKVLDAYCGVGTLSLLMAQSAQEVLGVECVSEAINDAKENAEKNGISNVTFECAKAEEFIGTIDALDVALLNPPRKGCAPELLNRLLEVKPKRVIYISCDPATLARDLQILSSGGYQLDSVTPFDMFPQTAHVETLVTLTRA